MAKFTDLISNLINSQAPDFVLEQHPKFLEFVKFNGYKKNMYWDPEGWNYLKSKKLEHPIIWKKIDDKWFENIFGKYKDLRLNNPIYNIYRIDIWNSKTNEIQNSIN